MKVGLSSDAYQLSTEDAVNREPAAPAARHIISEEIRQTDFSYILFRFDKGLSLAMFDFKFMNIMKSVDENVFCNLYLNECTPRVINKPFQSRIFAQV